MGRVSFSRRGILNSPAVRSLFQPSVESFYEIALRDSKKADAERGVKGGLEGEEDAKGVNGEVHGDRDEEEQEAEEDEEEGEDMVEADPARFIPTSASIHSHPQEKPALDSTRAAAATEVVDLKRKRGEEPDEAGEGLEQTTRRKVNTSFNRKNLPKDLLKYWSQRYRLFSLYDSGVTMDREGWFSVTPELIAAQIAERCRCDVIVDAFCGVGGNAIQFAFTCERVIAIDIDPVKLECALNNAKIYGVDDRIEFIQADFFEWAQNYVTRRDRISRSKSSLSTAEAGGGKGKRKSKKGGSAVSRDGSQISQEEDRNPEAVDVVFLSPPWGGPDYIDQTSNGTNGTPVAKPAAVGTPGELLLPTPVPHAASSSTSLDPSYYPLSALKPFPGQTIFSAARSITPNVALYVPRNVNVDELAALASGGKDDVKREVVELEEEWMSGKLKAITAYYGELCQQYSE